LRLSAARVLLGLAALLLVSAFQRAPAVAPGPFHDWAAVVVSADWRAATGEPTAAFENARRDVTAAVLSAGFRPDNLLTLGVDAKAPGVLETTPDNLRTGLAAVTGRARGGCLLYFTSHGSPEGISFGRPAAGELTMSPAALKLLLDATCGERPTVLMVSACFSGVYIPVVAAPNRMVLTAARPDRTSFGCGVDDRYPFFDACVLEAWPRAADFLALGRAVQACVANKEKALDLRPSSEPQLRVGGRIRPLLPLLSLLGAARPS
jgi:hypothetical protein